MAEMVGAVLAAFTVRTKLMETFSVPSSTVMVMVVVPLAPAAGVITRVRSASVPLKTILTSGTNAGFDEVAETINALGRDSGSPIVNAIGEVGVS